MDVLARYEPLVADPAAFRDACERPLPSVVRVNPIKATVDRVTAALEAADVAYEHVDWHPRLLRLPDGRPGRNWPYVQGWLHGQEEVSALPAVVLDPNGADRVWDACAAPGSKTTQLAALLDDRGRLVATDNNLGRIAPLRSNTERLGVTNVAVTREDARHHSLTPFDGAPYDATLVDVPCSCEGTIRKNPDALADWRLDRVRGVAGVQKGILERAVEVTRPGGTVVYATCTFAPEENEAVLDHVVSVTDATIESMELPLSHAPGVTEWQGTRYDRQVRHAARIYPHLNDTGGFFCAKLAVGG